jgi:hypothetical protein
MYAFTEGKPMDNDERLLIEGTIVDIEDSVDELKARRGRLAAWKKKLAELENAPVGSGRRRRGENLRMIKSCLEDSVEGLTASEVKTKTGLAWSSVQRVLSQNPALFVEVDGLWKLRQRIPKNPELINGTVKVSGTM